MYLSDTKYFFDLLKNLASDSEKQQNLVNQIRFKESLDHNNYFVVNFDESLNGVKAEFIMHKTSLGKNSEEYESWKFDNTDKWNQFCLSNSTSKIFNSQKFIIGQQKIA